MHLNSLKYLCCFFLVCILYDLRGTSGYSLSNFGRRYKRQYSGQSVPFTCKSGQHISYYKICDAVYDCEDKSDETIEECRNLGCPGFSFRCDYGACVNPECECDGHYDCPDGSDEKRCPVPMPSLPFPPPAVPTPQPVPVPSSEPCVLPNHPEHGQWTVFGGEFQYPNQKALDSAILHFSCYPGYKLIPDNAISVCINGEWSMQPPSCLRLCPILYSDEITTVFCYDGSKKPISCTDTINGTLAQYECTGGYELSDKLDQTRTCINGEWNLPNPKCVPGPNSKSFVNYNPVAVDFQLNLMLPNHSRVNENGDQPISFDDDLVEETLDN